MTDEQIVRALECLGGVALKCRECPYSPRFRFPICQQQVAKDTLDLIKRQQAEIDSLKAHLKRVCAERDARICTNNFIKSEAVKEFANILKNKIKTECNPYGKPTFDYDTSIAIMHYIDKLVKEEMVGEAE